MKNSLVLLLSFVCVNVFAQVNKSFPASGNKAVICMAPTADGGFIHLLQKDESLGATLIPVLIKTDSDFNTLWSKQLNFGFGGDIPAPTFSTIAELSDGGFALFYVAVGIYTPILVKFSAAGDFLWSSEVSGPSSMFGSYTHNSRFIEKADGKLIVMSTNYEDYKIYQFAADGTYEWGTRFYSSTSGAYGKDPGFDMTECDDSTIIVSGKSGNDNCFARITNTGTTLWTRVIDFDDSYSRPYGMCKTEDGNILVAGLRSDKGFVMKMSPVDGNILWQKEVNECYFENIMAIGDNKYALVGKTGDGLWTDGGMVVMAIDGDGELIASKKFTESIAAMPDIHLYRKNAKNYISFISAAPDSYVNFLEFDANLNFTCEMDPFTITKFAFTLPLLDLGTLEMTPATVGVLHDIVTTTDVVSNLEIIDFCTVFYTAPSTPVTTTGIASNSSAQAFYSSMDVAEINDHTISSLYPNPLSVGSVLNIQFSTADAYTITLFDVCGNLVSTTNATGISATVNTAGLSRGVYFVNISCLQNLKAIQRIVVE